MPSDPDGPLSVSSSSSPDRLSDTANSVFSKYATVWVWSILFGSSTAFIFNSSNYREFGKWPIGVALILGSLGFVSGISALGAIVLLLRYLVRFIVPMLSGEITTNSKGRPPADEQCRVMRTVASFLTLSFLSAIMAALAQSLLTALAYR